MRVRDGNRSTLATRRPPVPGRLLISAQTRGVQSGGISVVRSALVRLGLLVALVGGLPVRADFATALKDFNEGRYEAAHAEFQALAELGDPASQFNLGAMALQGQGGARDPGTAVGWLMAAVDNGYQRLARDKIDDMKLKLTDEQARTAADILGRYGRAGLAKTVLPVPGSNAHCPNRTPVRLTHAITPDSEFYPRSGRFNGQNGFVIVELTVGVDGVPRDPEVLMSVPGPEFSAAALDVWMPSRWDPARDDGVPVESRLLVKADFNITGGVGALWNLPALKKVREQASTGDPSSEYLIGLAATLDRSLGIPVSQAQALIVSAAQGGHAHAQYYVANRFMSLGSCEAEKKKLPWLRAAARSGDTSAQLALALDLLRNQPTSEQLAEARSLLEQAALSEDLYVLTHVAALLGASPLAELRDPAMAKAAADRLTKDPPELNPQLFEAAAAAYASHKDFWLAKSKEETAIKSATRLGWATAPMLERLALYRKSQPWTGDLFAATAAPTASPASR